MKKGTGVFGAIVALIICGSLFMFSRMAPGVFKGILIAGIIAIGLIAALIIVGVILAVRAASNDTGKKSSSASTASLDAEQAQILSRAREKLLELRRLVMRVKNREVHNRAGEICGVADRILQTLKQKPEKIPSVRQFLNYYLPTLGEIISKYRRIEESGVPHEDTTRKVISYLDDIKMAMDKQYENLFADDILDMSVEMEAMRMAAKRDGLISDEKVEVNENITLTL